MPYDRHQKIVDLSVLLHLGGQGSELNFIPIFILIGFLSLFISM